MKTQIKSSGVLDIRADIGRCKSPEEEHDLRQSIRIFDLDRGSHLLIRLQKAFFFLL